MTEAEAIRVVPLEAGAGPENPPCPACGEPLFGWIGGKPGLAGPVRRCESCGLGVVGAAGDPEQALRALEALREGDDPRIVNRAGFACSLGGVGWAGLQPGGRYLFTAEAVRRLVARRDQVVRAQRWRPLASLAVTWQTLLNSVTFGHNVALGALSGAPAALAPRSWQRRLDVLISIVGAIPALAIALPVELLGGATGRGAVISIHLEPF